MKCSHIVLEYTQSLFVDSNIFCMYCLLLVNVAHFSLHSFDHRVSCSCEEMHEWKKENSNDQLHCKNITNMDFHAEENFMKYRQKRISLPPDTNTQCVDGSLTLSSDSENIQLHAESQKTSCR